jgi:hypothetical protein
MGEEFTPSKNEWLSILLLASMWGFDIIRNLAIKKLGGLHLEPVEKMELCRRFEIDSSWAAGAYNALCARQQPLSQDEVVRVGLENSVLISQAREERVRKELHKTRLELSSERASGRFEELSELRLPRKLYKPKTAASLMIGKVGGVSFIQIPKVGLRYESYKIGLDPKGNAMLQSDIDDEY